ncbi:MAG: 2-oxo-4-hydroxy-4-carboxy-5-ureidoimidazoline decarboxylase [Sulfuriferula sp.]|nr:2-oxo-4-hydroxy-4-carboxy-5-ureidoimidazoline decarboxylase [Sulfuriferula sp.]
MALRSIDELNTLDQAGFIACLADIYEHSPWVAECASRQRPYVDVASLAAAMQACVQAADPATQLTLIRAHPELAGKLAVSGGLTAASRSEQAAAGLNHCSPEEFATLTALNNAYQAKFAFPFIVAVRGMQRADIIAAMQRRLSNTPEQEVVAALQQIGRIAQFRLNDLLTH